MSLQMLPCAKRAEQQLQASLTQRLLVTSHAFNSACCVTSKLSQVLGPLLLSSRYLYRHARQPCTLSLLCHLSTHITNQLNPACAAQTRMYRPKPGVLQSSGQEHAPHLIRFLDVIRGTLTAAPTRLLPVTNMPLWQQVREIIGQP